MRQGFTAHEKTHVLWGREFIVGASRSDEKASDLPRFQKKKKKTFIVVLGRKGCWVGDFEDKIVLHKFHERLGSSGNLESFYR